MKSIFVGLMLWIFVGGAHAAEVWEKDYGRLLKIYASPAGVDYAAWHRNPEDVRTLMNIADQIAKNGPRSNQTADALAYYINAYNVWMLRLVLEKYPIKSVRDIAPLFGVFTGKRIEVNGQKMSLNHLEKQIIIKQFAEPRIHFALNCASRSCPPLSSEPFTSAQLESQLDKVTRAFAQTDFAARVSSDQKQVALSKIFEWYADDFKEAGGPVAFLNGYRQPPIPTNARVSFQEYDWALNAAGP
jgi:hypothetical protein